VDPLRPFATLVRSLLTTKTRKTEASRKPTGNPSPIAPVAGSGEIQTVQQRLSARLPLPEQWNEDEARLIFVECILVAEFGDAVATDPQFANLIDRVSAHLCTEPPLTKRLDEVLRELASGRRRTE